MFKIFWCCWKPKPLDHDYEYVKEEKKELPSPSSQFVTIDI